MLAVLLAILSLTVFGIPLVLAVDRDVPPMRLLGLAFLYGSGGVYLVMLVLAIVQVRWTIVSVTVAALIVAMVAGLRSYGVAGQRAPQARPETPQHRNLATLIDLLTLLTLAGYTLLATIAPLWEWDFWAIWGLKARLFLERGGIDWRLLENPWNSFVHPDYPLLLPLNYELAALIGGGWSDRWLGIFFVAWAVALLLVVRSLAEEETTPVVAALITLALATVAASRFIGLAEGPLIAFAGAGILFVRRGLLRDDAVSWRHGAILLGFAASTKNEGLAMLASVAVAVALTDLRRAARNVLRLWPAAVLVAPWLILRAVHVLPTDLAVGPIGGRLAERLGDPLAVLALLTKYLNDRWYWVAIVAGILLVPAAERKRERFVLLFTAIQLAVYVVTYFATPHDVRWHILSAWPRLTTQVAAPAGFAVMLMLAHSWRGAEEWPHAEARSEQP